MQSAQVKTTQQSFSMKKFVIREAETLRTTVAKHCSG